MAINTHRPRRPPLTATADGHRFQLFMYIHHRLGIELVTPPARRPTLTATDPTRRPDDANGNRSSHNHPSEPAPAVKPPDSRTRSRPTQPDGQRTRPPHQPPNTRPARYARASRFGRLRGRLRQPNMTRPPLQPPNTRPARYARASRFGRLRGWLILTNRT